MDHLLIDVVATITNFLPLIDKLRIISTCRRFYHCPSLHKIRETIASYHPRLTSSFATVCRHGEEYFIDLHISRYYATMELALIYVARYGHLSLVHRYMMRTRSLQFPTTTLILIFALRSGRVDIFNEIMDIIDVIFNCSFDLTLILSHLSPSHCSIYEYLKWSRKASANIVAAVVQYGMNPYTAITFEPSLTETIMNLTERDDDFFNNIGPVSFEDELAFAYLSRDDAQVAKLKERMITNPTIVCHQKAKIIKAAIVTGQLKDAITTIGHGWNEDLSSVTYITDTAVPIIVDEVSRLFDEQQDDVASAVLEVADWMMISAIVIQLADRHHQNERVMAILMYVALVSMEVEAIEHLRDVYHIPYPEIKLGKMSSTLHDYRRYIHPRIIDHMVACHIPFEAIKRDFYHAGCEYLWEVYERGKMVMILVVALFVAWNR